MFVRNKLFLDKKMKMKYFILSLIIVACTIMPISIMLGLLFLEFFTDHLEIVIITYSSVTFGLIIIGRKLLNSYRLSYINAFFNYVTVESLNLITGHIKESLSSDSYQYNRKILIIIGDNIRSKEYLNNNNLIVYLNNNHETEILSTLYRKVNKYGIYYWTKKYHFKEKCINDLTYNQLAKYYHDMLMIEKIISKLTTIFNYT